MWHYVIHRDRHRGLLGAARIGRTAQSQEQFMAVLTSFKLEDGILKIRSHSPHTYWLMHASFACWDTPRASTRRQGCAAFLKIRSDPFMQVKDEAFKKLKHGADVVVTDEAHELRNAKSGMAVSMSKFSTKKRVALTGYPLQNKLEEYWTMIDWIGQSHVVGSAADFHEQYGLPIMKGTLTLYTYPSRPYENSHCTPLSRQVVIYGSLSCSICEAECPGALSVTRSGMPSQTVLATRCAEDMVSTCCMPYIATLDLPRLVHGPPTILPP